jgi:RNA polymerase sigma factor (sigma-70 family)
MEHVPGFQDLLARARSGDRAATDELLALIHPWLEQLARNHAALHRPDGSASDLVQEAWLRAWQKLDQFHGTEDEAQAVAMFRGWLACIVARLGLNAVREGEAKQLTPPGKLLRLDGESAVLLDPSTGEPTPSACVQEAEQARLVQEALARLTDPLDRDIVRLRFSEGMSLRQAAQRLGLNHETVRQRYHALLRRLQQDLNGLL